MGILNAPRELDAHERQQLATAYRHITAAHAIVSDLIRGKVDGLEWADKCLIEAGSDVSGIHKNSEPMSFR